MTSFVFRGLFLLKKTDWAIKSLAKQNAYVHGVFADVVKKNPKKIMLVNSEKEWTAEEVDKFSNKVAAYFVQRGFKPGDEVALFMR